ncbi:MAG: class I SAM-dependent methyltransferase, partial [Deltaproteobacteria bacterium]|nr:class I SAM-dependent methyltransferase [Deltaproteobacteria bacterium]
IPLPSESVDACICTNALDHMYSPYDALKEMYRIIKPGGYFALAVDIGGTPDHPIAIKEDDLEAYLTAEHFDIIEKRCSSNIRSTWPDELKIPLYVFQGNKVRRESSSRHFVAGDLSKTRPVSSLFGCDRGMPIDRYYIEKFLEKNRHWIRGRVLEIGDNIYTRKYGSQVSRSDVLGYTHTPKTTIVGDLSTGENIPMMAFDCIIMTPTIQFIYDVKSAIKNAFGALNPGGRLLITTSGLSQISRYDMERWGDYWRFTDRCLKMLLGEVFENSNIDVDKYGNVAVAKAFLDGYALHETDPGIFDVCDPDYQIIVSAVASK